MNANHSGKIRSTFKQVLHFIVPIDIQASLLAASQLLQQRAALWCRSTSYPSSYLYRAGNKRSISSHFRAPNPDHS